jgi:uncharacterized protein
MEIIGYICCLLIGLSLGLIGAGGSILTVPILVYLLGIDPLLATTYSLVVVGTTSSIGAWQKRSLVDIKTAFVFGSTSLISVYITKAIILPFIPVSICGITQQTITMVLFACLMGVAGYKILNKRPINTQEISLKLSKMTQQGVLVGFLTGILGVGGGFLITPSLILFGGIQIRKAAATSLVVIAANCAIGFLSAYQPDFEIDTVVVVTLLSIIGMIVGVRYANLMSQRTLEKGFAYLIFFISITIVIKELC